MAAKLLALCLTLVLFGAVPVSAEVDDLDPFTAWDSAGYTVDRGIDTTISGVVAGAGDDAEVVVERQDGSGWTALPTEQEDERFSVEVPGETATYRAVLTTAGEEFTSDEVAVL